MKNFSHSLAPLSLAVFFLFSVLGTSVRAGEPGTKYGPNAEPFSRAAHAEYFKRGGGADFWRLFPFYIGQDTGSGCSLAALTTLLNGVQAMDLKKKANAATKNFVMSEMRKGFLDPDYVARMGGDPKEALLKHTRLGISIVDFRDVVEKALVKGELTSIKPEVKLVGLRTKDGEWRKAERAAFFADLKKNEKSDDDFIILNFVQGILTGDPEGVVAHIAIVGGYDEKTDAVLILDPDREYYQPYWAPAGKVFDAIIDPHADSKAPGYLVVRVK